MLAARLLLHCRTAALFAGAPALNPLVFALARDALGSALLLTAAGVEAARAAPRRRWAPAWADAGGVALLGLTGVWGAQGMSALAIKFSTPVFFSASTNFQPVVTFLLSFALRMEPWRGWRAATSWGKVAGLAATAACGASVVIASAAGGPASLAGGALNFPLGAGFAALQVLMGGALPVVQKPLLARYTPLQLTGWGYAAGTVMLAMSVITGATNADDWKGVGSVQFLAGVAYAGVLSSAVAYAIMSFVNSKMSPTFVAIFMPSTTFFAIAFAWLFQGRALAPIVLLPLVGMWLGIGLLVLSQDRERRILAVEAAAAGKSLNDAFDAPLLAPAED